MCWISLVNQPHLHVKWSLTLASCSLNHPHLEPQQFQWKHFCIESAAFAHFAKHLTITALFNYVFFPSAGDLEFWNCPSCLHCFERGMVWIWQCYWLIWTYYTRCCQLWIKKIVVGVSISFKELCAPRIHFCHQTFQTQDSLTTDFNSVKSILLTNLL